MKILTTGSYLEFCHTRLTTEVPQEVIAFWNSGEIERDRLSRVLVNDDQRSVVMLRIRAGIYTEEVGVEVRDINMCAPFPEERSVSDTSNISRIKRIHRWYILPSEEPVRKSDRSLFVGCGLMQWQLIMRQIRYRAWSDPPNM